MKRALCSSRLMTGALVTVAVLAAADLCDDYLFRLPNPSALYLCAIAYSAVIGGLRGGLVSAAIALAHACLYFSLPGHVLSFSPEGLIRLGVLGVAAVVLAGMVGWLHLKLSGAVGRHARDHRDLVALRSALDQVTYAVLLLDRELRARFVNRAFRSMWCLPDAIADRSPGFAELLMHGREIGAYNISAEAFDAYIEGRLEHLRSGIEDPLELRLTDGRVLRFESIVLSDGGRMVTYTDVTRSVHDAERFEQLATKDGLTGLLNEQHFLYLGQREWERFLRYRRPLSLLVLDIDRLRTVNERFGEEAGDLVLKEVAARCRDALRTTDILARIGGEEIAILLPETPVLIAAETAERLRCRICEAPVRFSSASLPITVSLGIAAAAQGNEGIAGLLRSADQALGDAKDRGRNRVALQSKVT